jgi:hypothetical protein
MAKRQPEGMMMAPNNGGSSAGSGGGKRPIGETPAVNSGAEDRDPNECRIEPEKPMEVVFAQQTFRKLIAWTFGPLLVVLVGGLGAFFYFYHRTNTHLEDPTIHLTRGERSKLETKAEAKRSREELETDIKRHFDLKTGQIQLNNAKQINKIGKQLQTEQRVHYQRILKEIKKAN